MFSFYKPCKLSKYLSFSGVFRVYKIEAFVTKGLKANFQTSFAAYLCEYSVEKKLVLTFGKQHIVIILKHFQKPKA